MKHILFTLKGCLHSVLNDEEFIRDCMYNASKHCNSKLLALHSHKFEPQGVTAVAMLAESHISIHTWPERGAAVCDVFTCGDHTKPETGVEYLKNILGATNIICDEFVRQLD